MTKQKDSRMPDQLPEKARRETTKPSIAYIGIDRIVANPDVSTDISVIVTSIDLSEKVTAFEPVHIDQHNVLLTQQPEFFQRFNENPNIASLLFVNPVLAFREAGITMSPEIARHVLRSVYQPKHVRDRLAVLETKLKEALGEMPRPHDPEWAATFLFEKLKLPPLDTTGVEPVYLPSRAAEAIAKLNARRPKGSSRYKIKRRTHSK
ncbi:MAG TPA: hypothetical protein VJZ27_02110, partial [Aggregatilineales bacterium]|nr:hypothetical protein [Aggregatilineales bacterium]